MVKTTAFKFKKHYQALLDLHEAHAYEGLSFITKESLPKIGFVAYSSTDYIAIGFLRRVEGGFAQIDTLVSNKALSSAVRNEGVTLVVDALLAAAKDHKLSGVLGFVTEMSLVSRGDALGFKVLPHSIIGLSLNKPD